MKRLAIIVLMLISVSGSLHAQSSTGFLALTTVDSTYCGASTEGTVLITYRIVVVPGPQGAVGAEFMLEYPPSLTPAGFSSNQAVVSGDYGSLTSGIVCEFIACQMEMVWIYEDMCLVKYSAQDTIKIVPKPGNSSVRLYDCNYVIEDVVGTPFLLNQEVPCIACDISPTSIDFGQVGIGQPAVDNTFEITNTGVFPISGIVSELCPDYSVLDASYSLLAGESQLVTVRFEPTSVGTHNCAIDTGSDSCSDVSCTGVGLDPTSDCQVEPTSIDFGFVPVSGNRDTTFTITYTGSGFISDTVRAPCSYYSIVSDSAYNLGTGEWKDFTLRFAPMTAGVHPCTLDTGDSICAGIICAGFGCPSGRLYVDAGSGGADDGSSWLDAYNDLQSALGYAAAYSGCPFEIWVAEGVYKPTGGTDRNASFQLQSGVALYGGFAGGETALNQRDWASNPTVLSGDIGSQGVNLDNSYHVVRSNGTDSTAVLDGFIITGGCADVYGVEDRGAGIRNDSSSPTIVNVIFSDNYAYTCGGGMYNEYSNPKLINVIFIGNSTTYLWSGGAGLGNAYSDPTLVNVTFTQNNSGNGVGGGMHGYQSDPIVVNSIFWGNTSGSGEQEINNNTSAPDVSYSLIEGGLSSGCVDGGNNIDADPRFVDAASGDLRLWSSSPALEAGDNTAVTGVPVDLGGNPRTYGTYVDMGAYEYQGLPTGIEEGPTGALPQATALRAVYPNPFNPTLTMEFDLDYKRSIQMTIYDVGGRLVRVLLDETRGPGAYKIVWDGRDDAGHSVATGVYFLRFRSQEFRVLRKVVLLK